jgi:hypothetical protein
MGNGVLEALRAGFGLPASALGNKITIGIKYPEAGVLNPFFCVGPRTSFPGPVALKAFERGLEISALVAHDLALPVQEDKSRHSADLVSFGHLAILVQKHRVGQRIPRSELGDFALGFIHIDIEHRELLLPALPVDFLDPGDFLFAVGAPRRSEYKQDGTIPQAAEIHLLPLEVLEPEIRRRLINGYLRRWSFRRFFADGASAHRKAEKEQQK